MTAQRSDPAATSTHPLVRVRQGREVVLMPAAPPTLPVVRRPAKLAQLLALAHHLERLIQRRTVADRAEIAARLGISRARVTQILDLTLLAPDIQEEILFAEAVDGVEPFAEASARKAAREVDWRAQRQVWRRQRSGYAAREEVGGAFAVLGDGSSADLSAIPCSLARAE